MITSTSRLTNSARLGFDFGETHGCLLACLLDCLLAFLPRSLQDYVKAYGPSGSLQYALQSALAEDSKELIDNIRSDDKVIVDVITNGLPDGVKCSPKSLPIALLGHSMGGGLLFWLAATADVRTFCSLAPFPKLQGQYDPAAVINDPERRNWRENILLIAGETTRGVMAQQ